MSTDPRARMEGDRVLDPDPMRLWRRLETQRGPIWLYGQNAVDSKHAFVARLEEAAQAEDVGALAAALHLLRSPFGLMAELGGVVVAAVDRVRTVPVFYDEASGRVAADAPKLAGDDARVNDVGALAIAMAGYTIGGDTLRPSIRQLRAGECLMVDAGGRIQVYDWGPYTPWQIAGSPPAGGWARALREVTLGILERVRRQATGKPIAIPLSAGRDSRLIASGLHALGEKNVVCFSYGVPGNREGEVAAHVAKALGYAWRFVATNGGPVRRLMRSGFLRDYQRFADHLDGPAFIQDVAVVRHLKNEGYLPDGALIVNGNSGDYISGNHVPVTLFDAAPADQEGRERTVVEAIAKKHFALWRALETERKLARIHARLREELGRIPGEARRSAPLSALYEFLEYQDRQAKYVVAGQRAYDFLGHPWALPLWDDAYLDFWATVPADLKRQQALYAAMLEHENWGGVWRGLPINPGRIRPHWIRPLRAVVKAMCVVAGRDAWHRAERNLFYPFMDNVGAYALFPYARVALDRRGQRHAVSWLAEAYLRERGAAAPFEGGA